MATITIHCPVCHMPLDLQYGIDVVPRIMKDENGKRSIEPGINFQVKHVEPADTRIVQVLEDIDHLVKPGIKITELARILREEYQVCQVHVPMMIDRIKEAYQLYTPDGQVLEIIK